MAPKQKYMSPNSTRACYQIKAIPPIIDGKKHDCYTANMLFYTPNTAQCAPYPYRNEFVYRSNLVWIGTFNCHHTHKRFNGLNHFEWHHMIVFPRTSVILKMCGHDPFVGSPNIAVFYNNDTVYERGQLTEEGDCCEFFQFNRSLLLEVLATYDPAVYEREHQLFQFTNAFVDKKLFIRQRKLLQLLNQPDHTTSLQLDEMAIEILEQLIEQSFSQKEGESRKKTKTRSAHYQLAFEAQKLMATHFDQKLTLQAIAKKLYVSPYHLSRLFRQETGKPLHQYLEQLRLRNALERLGDYAHDLNRLALDIGYANHSHFTAAFRKNFGYAPSQWAKFQQHSR